MSSSELKCPNCSTPLKVVPVRCTTCDSIIVTCPQCSGTGRYTYAVPSGGSQESPRTTETPCTTCVGAGIVDERRAVNDRD